MAAKKVFIKSENIVFLGDIHGNIRHITDFLARNTNTCLFVCGDIGFGFPELSVSYIRLLIDKRFNEMLTIRNNYVVFIRGNHDNPAIFKDKTIRRKLQSSDGRFKVIDDYTQVTVEDNEGVQTSVLCIGGGTSIDRAYRTQGITYWKDEEVEYEQYRSLRNPDVLCTHTIMRYAIPLKDEATFSRMINRDPKLMTDLVEEDKTMKKIYDYYKPRAWVHGHFHFSHDTTFEETHIRGLDVYEFYKYKKEEREDDRKSI